MKKIWQKIMAFLTLVFGGAKKFETFLQEHADDAIAIVTKIKEAVENPMIITLMSLLPEKYRNAAGQILAKIDSIINKVLQELVISDQCLKQTTTVLRLKCFIEHLKQLSPAAQEALLAKFASLYAKYSSGTQEKISRIDTAVQMRFLDLKEKLS
jgi:hypothetical protein